MRIALVLDSYYPHIDGVTRVVDNYARILNEMGDTAEVFVPRVKDYVDNFPYAVHRSASFHLAGDIAYPSPGANRDMVRALDALSPDIVHIHSPFTMGHYMLKHAHKRGIPVVATFHSKYYDDFRTYTHSRLLAKIGLDYIVDFYNKCDAVLGCSCGAVNTLHGYGYKGDMGVAPNAPDVNTAYPLSQEVRDELVRAAREAYGAPGEGFRLLFVGQSIWQKNIRFIIDTCARLKESGFRFVLTDVGCGKYEQDIRSYAVKMGLKDDVRFLGRVSDKRLLQGLYLDSDLFFFPSKYDTSGIVVQEAALNHIPSLLMRGTDTAAETQDGVNGFLTPDDPDECAVIIRRIASRREMLKTVGDCASQTLVNNWYTNVADIRGVYKQIIAQGLKH